MSRRRVMTFAPRLDILPPAQRRVWDELGATPPEFTLYGGTAIALQLGHRRSVDFDFFATRDFEPAKLKREVAYLAAGETVQSAENTLTVRVNRSGWVSLSFFRPPHIKPFAPSLEAADTGIKVAALIDLAGLKAELIQQRAQMKDYLDLDALFSAGISPIEAMAAARIIHGEDYSPEITVKALSYFGENDLPKLSEPVKRRLKAAAEGAVLHDIPAVRAALLAKYGKAKS